MFERHRHITATNQQALDILFADVEKNQKVVVKAGVRLGINLFGENRIVTAGRIMTENYIDTVELPSWLKYIPFKNRILAWAKTVAQNATEQTIRDNLDWFKRD